MGSSLLIGAWRVDVDGRVVTLRYLGSHPAEAWLELDTRGPPVFRHELYDGPEHIEIRVGTASAVFGSFFPQANAGPVAAANLATNRQRLDQAVLFLRGWYERFAVIRHEGNRVTFTIGRSGAYGVRNVSPVELLHLLPTMVHFANLVAASAWWQHFARLLH